MSGIRHTCLDCPNFDYCSTCVVKPSHDHLEHRFEQLRSSRTETASIVADHRLLQATIKEEMGAMHGSIQRPEVERDHVEPVSIILDCPDEEYADKQLALFLIMSSCTKSFHEGLVLVRVEDGARFRRVGFFSTRSESVFDGADLLEVELI